MPEPSSDDSSEEESSEDEPPAKKAAPAKVCWPLRRTPTTVIGALDRNLGTLHAQDQDAA